MPVDIARMSLAEIERRIEKVERLAALWRGQVIFLTGQVESGGSTQATLRLQRHTADRVGGREAERHPRRRESRHRGRNIFYPLTLFKIFWLLHGARHRPAAGSRR
jgi:hypothetical protein